MFISNQFVFCGTLVVVTIIVEITSPPQPVNIALNRTAEFNCTFIGNFILWEANRIQIENDIMGYMINTQPVGTQPPRMSTLTAFASLDKNNTNITCAAISTATFMVIKSEPAILRIQGECMCTYYGSTYMLSLLLNIFQQVCWSQSVTSL